MEFLGLGKARSASLDGDAEASEADRRAKRRRRPRDKRPASLIFLREFIRHPHQVASIVPSSKVLCRCVVDAAELGSAERIVELGPGTGGTTRAILNAMAPEARLLSIEGNPALFELVSGIRDERLVPYLGRAGDLRGVMARHGFEPPDVVISGIPLSTIGRAARAELLETIGASLAPRGRFVAYQVSKRILHLDAPHMRPAAAQRRVLLSVPPLWVLRWDKTGGDTGAAVH